MAGSKANHPPVVRLKGSKTISAKPGSTVGLSGIVKDPDGDRTSNKWWPYEEVDSYPGKIAIMNPGKLITSFKVPNDAQAGQTIHLILEVKDSGSPGLTRYQRVVVNVM